MKIRSYVVDSIHSELNHYFEDSVHFQIEDISFQFLKKKIVLEKVNINLIADQKDTLASLELPNIYISWDDYWETFNNQLYKFNTLELKKVKLLLPFDFRKIKMHEASRPSFDGRFELEIKDFLVEEGEILFYDERNSETGRITTNYNLIAKELKFVKGEIPKKLQDVAKNIFLEFHDLTYFLKDDIHKLDVKKLSFDLFKQDITLISTHFRPLHSPAEFAKLKKEEANHIDIFLDSVKLKSLKWQGDSMVSINTVYTNQVELIVTKDKNYLLPDDKFVPILVDLLKESDISIDVRRCIIQNMNLSYFEIPDGSQETGTVSIANIQGEIENITNRKDSIAKHGADLVIIATGDLYGEGKLKADIRYNLNSKYGYFTVAGSLQPMSIGAINQYLAKSAPVEIASGRIDELFFSYSGGNRAVSGEMEFKYSDLKIEFHKVINEEKQGDKALSWLANIALSQQNPKQNGRFRVGKIEFERDTRKSMFSYWSNSLVSGFQSTVGLSKASRIEKLEKEEKEDKNLWQKMGFGKDKDDE
ncbi:hypothetical protein QYS49_34725 [Marivirga salinae]|uniref:Uncharacterized protein n=1 Tax=Marivirga salinarum TaxID=3059078 RepID=A0AA51NCL8_9BACT|nr:hypothetical protein [Marivirga sp. BDSF4-3]WMN12814.1 hypothetical protein QYS49_34725 [Marivirga sp. BDSF4-3]